MIVQYLLMDSEHLTSVFDLQLTMNNFLAQFCFWPVLNKGSSYNAKEVNAE